MEFNDLLEKLQLDTTKVLLLRHRPYEPRFNKIFGWIASSRPEWFNAYQQTQGEALEKAMLSASYVASFIGHEPGRALFIGIYKIGESKPLTYDEYWSNEAHIEMNKLGMNGFSREDKRSAILQFDLQLQANFYASWKGKLVVGWPPPERSWWRRAHRNQLQILSVLEESYLDGSLPTWDRIVLNWEQLHVLPTRLKTVMSQWRAIYFIFDSADCKGYVGSAYGEENLFQRWEHYQSTGHGGNRFLKTRDPKNFIFSILQILPHNMSVEEVVDIENSWKKRLHTRSPYGLNDN